jgi:tubulin--tyrosine ligase-like protein 12
VESLPGLSDLNGVSVLKILEEEKDVVDAKLQPRLPECCSEEPLTDRILHAMWLYLMTYRLADEEKLDENPIWYGLPDSSPNFMVLQNS